LGEKKKTEREVETERGGKGEKRERKKDPVSGDIGRT
jgi:hypothetical protein